LGFVSVVDRVVGDPKADSSSCFFRWVKRLTRSVTAAGYAEDPVTVSSS
jgi:hypothetical protein